jgi:hypothetical protein
MGIRAAMRFLLLIFLTFRVRLGSDRSQSRGPKFGLLPGMDQSGSAAPGHVRIARMSRRHWIEKASWPLWLAFAAETLANDPRGHFFSTRCLLGLAI